MLCKKRPDLVWVAAKNPGAKIEAKGQKTYCAVDVDTYTVIRTKSVQKNAFGTFFCVPFDWLPPLLSAVVLKNCAFCGNLTF